VERRFILIIVLLVSVVIGCESNDADQIIALQKQVALLGRQLEQTQKELETLRETDKTAAQSLNALEAEVSRLTALEALPPPAAKSGIDEADVETSMVPETEVPAGSRLRAAERSAAKKTVEVPCAQVWALIGKGENETAVAKKLNASIERVRSCEREVGRGKTRESDSAY
jgi:hypothetical protein